MTPTDKSLGVDEFAVATRMESSSGDRGAGAVVMEKVMTSNFSAGRVTKASAIIVTCCEMEQIFNVELIPPEGGDVRELLKHTWVRIPKAAAFQCHKCQRWTVVEPLPPDGRLGVRRVEAFTPEISLLLRLLLELGDCINRGGRTETMGGCGECPFCLLKAKLKP